MIERKCLFIKPRPLFHYAKNSLLMLHRNIVYMYRFQVNKFQVSTKFKVNEPKRKCNWINKNDSCSQLAHYHIINRNKESYFFTV